MELRHAVLRPYAIAGVVLIGAGLIVAPPVTAPPPRVEVRTVALTSGDAAGAADPATVALIMSGSGAPTLPPTLFDFVNSFYIQPNFPGATAVSLGAPQQLYPLSGVHNGFFDTSVQAGVTILDDALTRQLADGNHVVVYGQSQGATIETLEMEHLASSAHPPNPDQLNFVLTGDPDLPNGGMLERFDFPGLPSNLTLPSLGVEFYGATPADTPYPTVIYTGEYDGFADFPRYPIDLLADVNALLGILYVHVASYFSQSSVDQAFVWQPSPGYDGDTTYYLIPTKDLPLLDPLRGNPLGNAIADLLQPDLRVLINLGYGPDNVGYGEYPNVSTPASGLFPDVNPLTVLDNLASGAQQGVHDFVADLTTMSPAGIFSTDPGPTVTPLDLNPGDVIPALQNVITDNSNALATLIAAPLDAFMPTVDVGAAVVTALPEVTSNLVIAGLGQLAAGDTSAAFTDVTDPIGGTVGLLSIAGFALLEVLDETAQRVTTAVQSAVTDDMDFIAGLAGLF
ncbi:PE-PPE domain-containing protein [Mycobacterium sp.]|uniref:PE-PPE domain-containing protein n=1 Tax=Mycobacterium sp. TaxID=1785 RepID=UPI0025E85F88|nr:PE-PPE domain-containing protein [Mycobacterium sp.]